MHSKTIWVMATACSEELIALWDMHRMACFSLRLTSQTPITWGRRRVGQSMQVLTQTLPKYLTLQTDLLTFQPRQPRSSVTKVPQSRGVRISSRTNLWKQGAMLLPQGTRRTQCHSLTINNLVQAFWTKIYLPLWTNSQVVLHSSIEETSNRIQILQPWLQVASVSNKGIQTSPKISLESTLQQQVSLRTNRPWAPPFNTSS